MHKAKLALLILFALLAILAFGISRLFVAPSDEEYVIAVTFAGMLDELERLVGKGRVSVVVTIGADPHDVSLTPEGVRTLSRALLIVTMGHTHVDHEVEKLKKTGEIKGVVINIVNLENVSRPVLPDGRINYHELYCDPYNLKVILEVVAKELIRIGAGGEEVQERLRALMRDIDSIVERKVTLEGRKAVIVYAGIQAQIEWLGLRVIHYLAEEPGSAPLPRALRQASVLLSQEDSVIAVVGIGASGEPLTDLDEWLLREAERLGRPVLKVRLCALSTSALETIRETAKAAERLIEES
ncbi:MAG: zinc ABC transporter substrate-binding protein [Acidilobaceae archaeon]